MALGSTGQRDAVSNNAVLVVHCDGPLAPERVTRSLERLLDVCPWPAARLRRPFPWGQLHWMARRRTALAPPPVVRRTVATPEAFHQAVDAELNTAIDPRREPPLRFLILDGAPDTGRTPGVLVMTWFHPLMDPRGAQNLLGHLGVLDDHAGDSPWGAAVPAFEPAPDARPLRERGRLARKSVEYMRSVSRVPSGSPRAGRNGPVRFRQKSFVDRDSAGREDRATREIWWRLAVVGKALGEIWTRRGLPDVPVLLPVAVDLRPKGEPGPTFGNMLAFHFARFRLIGRRRHPSAGERAAQPDGRRRPPGTDRGQRGRDDLSEVPPAPDDPASRAIDLGRRDTSRSTARTSQISPPHWLDASGVAS